MKNFSAASVQTGLQWLRIYMLYRRAFPRNERKPFRMIRSMHRKGKTDVWYYESDGRFAGFATTINGDGLILLDYLAVQNKLRSRGLGSRIMEDLQFRYAGNGLFVEIESAFEPGADREDRLRRRRFYINADMQPMGVMADVFGVRMELLGRHCCLDFAGYRAFYREHYSEWAAQHILPAEFPGEAVDGMPDS